MTRTEIRKQAEAIKTKIHLDDRNYLYIVLNEKGEVEKDSQLRPRIYQRLEQARRCLRSCCLQNERHKYWIGIYQIDDIVPINDVLEGENEDD